MAIFEPVRREEFLFILQMENIYPISYSPGMSVMWLSVAKPVIRYSLLLPTKYTVC